MTNGAAIAVTARVKRSERYAIRCLTMLIASALQARTARRASLQIS